MRIEKKITPERLRPEKYGLFLVCFLLMSCDFFPSKQEAKEKLVEEEIKSIDWEHLDQYPLFENCDETAVTPVQKMCFETTLTTRLEADLRRQQFTVNEPLNDTIWIQFLISNQGKIVLLDIERSVSTARLLPRLDSVFESSINRLPRLYPPLKHHIPVAAKFKLPVVLHME